MYTSALSQISGGKGMIPKSAFAEGLDLCKRMGEKLLEEARLAFKGKAFRCAFILGFAAWEEFGKAALILENWSKDSIEKDAWRKKFLSHQVKIRVASRISDQVLLKKVINELGRPEEDFEIRLDEEFLKKMLRMRVGTCLYTNFDFEDRIWKSPLEIQDGLHHWAVNAIIQAQSARNALQSTKKEPPKV